MMKNEAKTSQRRSKEMQMAAEGQHHAHDVLNQHVVFYFWMLHSEARMGTLLASATDEQQMQRHWEILRHLCI